jgi:hypothetical protein
MFRHYEDILSRIAEPPRWFDEHGVPRYCAFAYDQIANIHARECALLAIECQSCGRPFLVAVDDRSGNHNLLSRRRREETPWHTLADIIRSHEIEYGDPPNVSCCEEGLTQNTIPRRVVEYWTRYQDTDIEPGLMPVVGRDWRRDHSLEIEIPDTGDPAIAR